MSNLKKNSLEEAAPAFVITRVFAAPRELVFAAWTQPEHILHWWGPRGFTAPHATVDLRVGGEFHFCMRSPEGLEYWNKGVFHEIIAPEKIVSTMWFSDREGRKLAATHYGLGEDMPREMRDVVTFEEVDRNKTRLTLRRDTPMDVARRYQMDLGWSSSLDKFAAVVEQA